MGSEPDAGRNMGSTAGVGTAGELVSIVIPCYNQRRYLREAVESAVAQSHAPIEVIVVDDGSSEDVRSVAGACAGVRYVRQANLGVATARNNGFLQCHGRYVIFLDSDDRLAPDCAQIGVRVLKARPEAAAAVGLCRVIGTDGEPRPFRQQARVGGDVYLELLRGNFIWMPAQVLYRRDAFASIGGFDTTVDACADYDLYLRLARVYELAVHREIVADYRQHAENMSGDALLMLRSALAVLERQVPYTRSDARYRRAQAAGRRFWKDFYGEQVVEQIRTSVRTPGGRSTALGTAMMLLRYHPRGFTFHLGRKLRCLAADLAARLQRRKSKV